MSAYKVGAFVDTVIDGHYKPCMVQKVTKRGRGVFYELVTLNNGQTLERRQADVKDATQFRSQMEAEFGFDDPFPDAEGMEDFKPPKSSRFFRKTEEEIDNMQRNSKSARTDCQTRWSVKQFKEWLATSDLKDFSFETDEKEQVAVVLRRFYAEISSQEGQHYSRSSLLGIRGGLQRHIQSPPLNKTYSLISDPVFKVANGVLAGNIRQLKQLGKDIRKSHHPIPDADRVLMYSSGVLGMEDPTALQYKTFFELILHFGRRGCEGLRQLRKDSLQFLKDDHGKDYVTLSFNPLEKNHQGLKKSDTEHEQRMYATGGDNCPLSSLRFYLSKLNPKNPWLFQHARSSGDYDDPVWYTCVPVGASTLAEYMPRISEAANLSRQYTNHCIRATVVTLLRNEGLESNDIMSVTGHKSTASIQSYSKTSDKARGNMSHTLSAALGYRMPSDDESDHKSEPPKVKKKRNLSLKKKSVTFARPEMPEDEFDTPTKIPSSQFESLEAKQRSPPQAKSPVADMSFSFLPSPGKPSPVKELTVKAVSGILSDGGNGTMDVDQKTVSILLTPDKKVASDVISPGRIMSKAKSMFSNTNFSNCTFNFKLQNN